MRDYISGDGVPCSMIPRDQIVQELGRLCRGGELLPSSVAQGITRENIIERLKIELLSRALEGRDS
jgi:hypothetical protein